VGDLLSRCKLSDVRARLTAILAGGIAPQPVPAAAAAGSIELF
jgi:hypothetical protein